MTDATRARWYAIADRVSPSYSLLAIAVIGGLFVSGRFHPVDDPSRPTPLIWWILAGAFLMVSSLLARRRLNGDWIPREVRTAAGTEPALVAPRSFVVDTVWATGLLVIAAPGARWAGSPSFDDWDDVTLVLGISILTAMCYGWWSNDLPRLLRESSSYTVDQERVVTVLRHFARHPDQVARFTVPGQRLADLLPTADQEPLRRRTP